MLTLVIFYFFEFLAFVHYKYRITNQLYYMIRDSVGYFDMITLIMGVYLIEMETVIS